jgi:tryptophanyl-tRNA synthetase
MCGECKNQAAYMMRNFFEELSKKRISAEDDARKILNKN